VFSSKKTVGNFPPKLTAGARPIFPGPAGGPLGWRRLALTCKLPGFSPASGV